MNNKIAGLAPGVVEVSAELQRTTVADLAGTLPCGPALTGPRVPFVFRPPVMGLLREIGALKGKKAIAGIPGKHACYAMAKALRSLGERTMGEASGDKGAASDALAIADLTIGDVLHLGFAWQEAKEPDGIVLRDQICRECLTAFPEVVADLRTLEVYARPEDLDEPLSARVGLRRGFMHAGRKVSTVLVQPPRWRDVFWLLQPEDWKNAEKVEAFSIKSAIVGTDAEYDGTARPNVGMTEIDQLWPQDVRLLSDAIARIAPTPDLRVHLTCPSCGADALVALGWTDPGFFGG